MKNNRKLVSALMITLVMVYLVGHALTGERGVFVLLKEQRRLEALNTELDQTSKERKSLEHKVQLLCSNSLDLDLLDEQSRRYLSTADKSEIVIPVTPAKTEQGK